jgi:alpha-amylase/alpha-mannosidase (GH57 family)
MHETALCREQLGQIRGDLAKFEEQYDCSSDEFYRRYQAGQTDDRMDYIEWASLAQMRDNLQQRLHILTGESQPTS